MIAHAERRTLKDGSTRWYAIYLASNGRRTSGGGFSTKREAERAATKLATAVEGGGVPAAAGRITFAAYVEHYYWPATQHLEPTTRAAYRSNLDKHFLPAFGRLRLSAIRPTTIDAWVSTVTQASDDGRQLSPRSVRKYHTLLHAIFARAIIDQLIAVNPCSHTRLPKVVSGAKTAMTPEQFDALMDCLDPRYRLMALVAIESGMRWGELIALRPVDVDSARRTILVRRVVLEVSTKITPSGERYLFRDYPKDNEHREVLVSPELCRRITTHMLDEGIRGDALLFATSTGRPISRNTFRTRVWRPAVERAGLQGVARFHDLRGAHASWLLSGGADLKTVMDRLGHRQITTTQQYLGALPDSGERALVAFQSIRDRAR